MLWAGHAGHTFSRFPEHVLMGKISHCDVTKGLDTSSGGECQQPRSGVGFSLWNRPRYSSLATTVENQNSIFFCREAVNRGLNVLLPERLTVESLWQCNEVEGEKQNSLNLRHNTGFQTLSKYWFSIQFSILATTEVSSGEGGGHEYWYFDTTEKSYWIVFSF